MSATCNLVGGLGNHFYQIAHLVSYAKRHGMDYYIPSVPCAYNRPSFGIGSIGTYPFQPTIYREPSDGKNPYYHEIPAMKDPIFQGYWQSFKYFDWCRQDILDLFNFPSNIEYGVVGLGVRRGDAIGQEETFPMAPMEYYHECVEYMQKKGYNRFRVYTDDNPWCQQEFTIERYPGAVFEFYEGNDFVQKYISFSQVEHYICARSTFDFTAAWLNRNPDKIVLCPPWPFFKNCHRDMVPDYYTVIDCEITTTQDWADEYKNRQKNIPVSITSSLLKLPTVTLLTLATRDVDVAVKALQYSMKDIEFGKVALVSDTRPDNLPDTIQWQQVHRMVTIDDWNHEVFYNLWKYFDTEFVLFIHPDGFVVNPQSWRDEFLHYDYIGAPWPIDCAHAIRGPRIDTHELVRVGNSVGIRSRKLCKLPSEVGIPWVRYNNDYNEDTQITSHNRKIFIENGCKFASLELAVYFGREAEISEGAHIEHPFIFHKWGGRNVNYPRL